jgi:hypothetical protein
MTYTPWRTGVEADRDPVDIRHKAVEVLLATTAGAYQTTLLTYMIQRDLFPSIMKVCQSHSVHRPFTG